MKLIVKKQVLSFFFLGLMLIKICILPLVYLDFEVRRDYIVNYLCVNRDKPALNCNGKCYLAKRIAEAREAEQQKTERSFIFQLYEILAEPAGTGSSLLPENMGFTELTTLPVYYTSPLKGRLPVLGIFHPPAQHILIVA